jgi:hypothetical protein
LPGAGCRFTKRDLKTAVQAVEEQTGRLVARVRISRAGEIELEMALGPADSAPAVDEDPMAARQRALGLLPKER